MRTKVIIAILLLLMAISTIYASEDPTEQAEYLQKKQQLDLLAERFKAETGFKGDIETSCEQMKLSRFTGNFADIDMTNVRDSVAFRQVCNTVISKLLPFIGAKSEQLVPERINVDSRQIDTRYYQIVNGYKVESGGYLNVYYLFDQKRFGILNVTADISQEKLVPVLELADAVRIYNNIVPDDQLVHYFPNRNPRFRLAYADIYKFDFKKAPEYRLCWIGGSVRYLVIDSITGQIYINELLVTHDLSLSVKGTALLESDNSGNLQDSLYSFFDTRVYAVCDGEPTENFTDSQGDCSFLGNTITNVKAYLESSMVTMFDGSVSNPNQFIQLPSDSTNTSIVFDYNNYIGNPGNQYYHAIKYFDWISNDLISSPFQYPQLDIVTGCTMPEFGLYQPGNSTIMICHDSGMYSSTVCHEMTHALVYHLLNHNFISPYLSSVQNQIQFYGMDEAFSIYFPCAYRNNARYWQPTQAILLSDTLSIIAVHNNPDYTPPNTALNEDFYSFYGCREPIASAWWALRNNAVFGPEFSPEIKAFDDVIIKALKQDVDPSFFSRYKPRYFYNLLMQRVADFGQTTGLNDMQRALDAAYSSRGLHFNPKVESFSGGNKGRNLYNLGDPVYASLSNFPQNTAFTLYVIDHNSYNYVDGGFVPTSSCFAQGFTPISGTTDEDGNYLFTTPIWTASTAGAYDILVDIGSPTAPDGIIHFTFSAANVMDGIDGRTKPGFMVTDVGIDVVMAEQASAEAQLAEIHQ